MITFTNRLRKCPFRRPSTFDSFKGYRRCNSIFLSPFRKTRRFAINCVPSVSSSVPRLRFTCSPPDISRNIVSIIVDPLNAHSMWAFSNVHKKIFKRFHPSLANGNPSTSITMKAPIQWIIASGYHSTPNVVNTRSRFTVLKTKATARFGVARWKPTCVDFKTWRTTRALDNHSSNRTPIAVAPTCRVCNHFKSSKSLSDEVYSGRHGIGSFNVMLSGGRPVATGAHYVLIKGLNLRAVNQYYAPAL